MLATTKTFELGNTIYFECLFRNMDGSLTDPSNPTWTVKNIKGNTVASGGLLKRTVGIWYCFWTPNTVGDYILTMSGTIEENPVIIKRLFKVVEIRLK